jgi:Acetyltransferase (GNAT) domain
MTVQIRCTSPAPRGPWRTLLASCADALVFQTPEWIDSLCESGAYHDVSRLYEVSEGRYLLVPMVRRAALPKPLRIEASLPYGWGFGGIVAPQGVTGSEVSAVLGRLLEDGALRVSLRPNPLTARAWAEATPRGIASIGRTAHVLDLAGGFEEVWRDRFAGSARTAIRKARKSTLQVTSDTSGALVPVFYGLYLKSVDRWATKRGEPLWLARRRAAVREPLAKLRTVAKHLGEACRIWVAWLNGRPAAGVIVLHQGRSASYWRGAMDSDLAGPTRANYLLHSLAIEEACLAGRRYYHMGETGSSKSLAQFKSRFGARSHSYSEYRIERLPLTAVTKRVREWLP